MAQNTDPGAAALDESSRANQAGEGDVDVSLLEDSLRLSPWQRLVENDRALALVRMFEQARPRDDGTTESNPRTA